jgi:hypothetical protein
MFTGQNPVDILCNLPVLPTAGSFIVTDPKGTSRYAFIGLAQSHFYALDLWSGALTLLPVFPAQFVWGAGMCAAYDATLGRLWVVGPGTGAGDDSHTGYWNVATGAWVAADAGNTLDALLGATWATAGTLLALTADLSGAYPLTNAASVVDLVLRGSGLNAQYQYRINTDTWVASAVPGAASAAGCSYAVPWALDHAHVYSTHGGASAVLRRWDIAANTWADVTPIPPFTSTISAGTSLLTHPNGRLILARIGTTGQIVAYDPHTNAQVPYADLMGADGYPEAGTRLCAYTQNGSTYLVALLHGSTQVQRIRIVE